jgi:hypothetical protein
VSAPFDAGGPVLGVPVLGVPALDVAVPGADDRLDEPARDDRSPGEPPSQSDSATTVNPRGTVAVTATSTGLPIDVRIDSRELRYGGGELAAAILDLCRRSTQEAKARRRDELAAAGVRDDILDQLGLPERDALSADQARRDANESAAPTWMRPV